MRYPGGYAIVDCFGVELSASQAVTTSDSMMANILRATDKPVILNNLTVGSMTVRAQEICCTDTGAQDGKVRHFRIATNFFTVTTDDANITFTPA